MTDLSLERSAFGRRVDGSGGGQGFRPRVMREVMRGLERDWRVSSVARKPVEPAMMSFIFFWGGGGGGGE